MSNKKEFKKNYNKLIDELQIKLVHMQDWVIENNKKVVIIFEGRDAAVSYTHLTLPTKA